MSIGQTMKQIGTILLITFVAAAQAQTYEVAGYEFLNMREGPASTFPVNQRLQSGVNGIVLIGKPVFNGATKWQKVNSRDVIGWVNAYYLKESIQPQPAAAPVPVRRAIAVEQPTPQPAATPTPIVINEHVTEPISTPTPAFTLGRPPQVERFPNRATISFVLTLGILFGTILQWCSGLTPAFVYRFLIFKQPVERSKAAMFLAPVVLAIGLLYKLVIMEITDTRFDQNWFPWVFMFLVGKWIMTRGRVEMFYPQTKIRK
jgi:hypothetical protein